MSMRNATLVACVLVVVASCRPDDQRTDELDPTGGAQSRENMPAAAVAQLDSGNAAMRADDFETALDHFRRVTEIAPDFGSGWFGLYMAHLELGNDADAAAALERARGAVPGASLLHPDARDTIP